MRIRASAKATADAFRRAGAAVVGLDLDPRVEDDDADDDGLLGITCDVTDAAAVDAALVRAVDTFGGVDIVVCNAGVFLRRHGSKPSTQRRGGQ